MANDFYDTTMLPNIATLRAINVSDLACVYVCGSVTPGDGGGGFYYRDPADTTSADNNLTVIVTAYGQRWKTSLALLPYKQVEFQAPNATGNLVISNIGFKPRAVEIRATLVSTSVAYQSHGSYSPGIQRVHSQCSDLAGRGGYNNSDQIISLKDTASLVACTASLTSVNDSGFTLNFTAVTLRPWCLATCYW